MCLGSPQALYSNAAEKGLAGEGLRTRTRVGGGDYSEVQFGNATTATSFRYPVAVSADDFQVDTPWKVTSVTVFGYQPTLHYPSIVSGNAEIHSSSWDGPLIAKGALVQSVLTDIYRIFNNNPNDDRQVQRLSFKFNAVLKPGYYWLTFEASGVQNVDGPWGPYLTKVGALTVPGANARKRVTGPFNLWQPIQDAGSGLPQDLPFFIDGHRLQSIGPLDRVIPMPLPGPAFESELMAAFGVAW